MRWWRWVKYDYEWYIYSKIARRPNLKRCFKVTAAQQRLRSLWENICMKGVGRTIGGCERIEARFSFWFPLKHSILLCNVRSTDDCHKKKTFSLQYPTQPIYQNVNKEFSSNCGLYCTRILFLDQAKIVLTLELVQLIEIVNTYCPNSNFRRVVVHEKNWLITLWQLIPYFSQLKYVDTFGFTFP